MPQDGRTVDDKVKNILTLSGLVDGRAEPHFYGYVVQNQFVGGEGAGVILQRNCPGGEFSSPAFEDFHLNIALTGGHRTYDCYNGVVREGRGEAGQIGLTPAGETGELSLQGTFSSLHIALPYSMLQRTSDTIGAGRAPDLEGLLHLYFHDPAILWAATTISKTAMQGGAGDMLHSDQALWTLSALLLQRAGSLDIARRDTAPLDNDVFGKVTEMFMAHFDLPLTVQALADRVGMDPFSFSRAFKARTGKSPYQYLLHLRVERALHMLTNTDMTLAEMAYACGFSSQAHFTTVFKRIVGVSPGAYRLGR